MKEKINLLNFNKIKFTKLNDQFMLAKCYVLALGKNENKTYFSKENVDKAYESLQFIPVIGHVMTDDNGNFYLGGHDVKLVVDKGIKLKSLCLPYGVAIPSPTPNYENVIEEDGSKVEYLTTNVILWTGRYPEIEKTFYDENVLCGQSMEVLYNKAEPLKEDESYLNIIDFTFDALCMLGKSDDSKFNIEPCFPNAKLEPATFSVDENVFYEFKKDIIKELSSLKILDFCKEGGIKMDERLELLKKYNVKQDELDFDISSSSLEEIENKLKEFSKSKLSKFTTYNEKRNVIRKLFKEKVERDSDNNIIKEVYYYLMDLDDNYAYVEETISTKDDYTSQMYRYPYSFNESNNTATISGEREKLYKMWLTQAEKDKLNEEKNKYESYKESHTYTNEEYKELEEYKVAREKEEFNLAIENISNNYTDIKDKDEFKLLYKNKNNYSKDSFEKECIYIRGLYAKVSGKNKKEKNNLLKFGINNNDDLNDTNSKSYLFDKYLNN